MERTIELCVVTTELGGEAVLATPEEVRAAAGRMRAGAEGQDAETARAMLSAADETERVGLANWEALSETAEVRRFPFRPYTGRELLEAESSATEYDAKGGARVRGYELDRGLVCASCGMSGEAFDGLSPAVQRALSARVRLHSEPSAEGLVFLCCRRTVSG